MVAHGYRGIDVDRIGEMASLLDSRAGELHNRGRMVAGLLEGRGEQAAATDVATALGRVAQWASETSGELLWRRDVIARGQNAGPAASYSLRSLDPSLLATFAATVPYEPSARDRAYHDWLAQTHPGIAAAELCDIQERIDSWQGTDNDAILDDLIRQARTWRDTLGITNATMLDIAAAIEQGLTPQEAGLPHYLFPPEYLSALRTYARTMARLEELEAEYRTLVEDGGNYLSAGLYMEYNATLDIRVALDAELDVVSADLVEPTWTVRGIHAFLMGTPFLGSVEQQQVAGIYLAAEMEENQDSLSAMGTIAGLLAAGSRIEAQAFFDTLGPGTTAALPAMIASSNLATEPGGPAYEALRAFSIALGNASKQGLSFSGSQLLPPNSYETFPPYPAQVNPAVLFVYGNFDDEFVIDATMSVFENEDYLSRLTTQFGSLVQMMGADAMGLVDSWDDVGDGQWVDYRIILLDRVSELGPETAARFITAAKDRGVLDEFLRPIQAYNDEGTSAGSILAQLTQQTAAADTVINEIAHSGKLQLGIAVGAELMFLPNLTSLIQTNHAAGLVTPISPLSAIDPLVLDLFLYTLFASGAGQDLRDGVTNLILLEAGLKAATMGGDAAQQAIRDFNEALGEMAIRIEDQFDLAGVDAAKSADEAAAAKATIVGMAGEAIGALLLPELVVWQELAAGAGAGLGMGWLTDRVFPQEELSLFYEGRYEELRERSTRTEALTINLLHELGLIDGAQRPVDPADYQEWLDNTMAGGRSIDSWIDTVLGIYNKADSVRSRVDAG